MHKISWPSIFIDGPVCGTVLFLLTGADAVLSDFLIQSSDVFAELGVPMFSLELRVVLPGLAVSMFSGFACVWLYASMRPRYGPGPLTAARVGLGLGLIVASPSLMWTVILNLPLDFTIWAVVSSLVHAQVITQLGAWMYTEPED